MMSAAETLYYMTPSDVRPPLKTYYLRCRQPQVYMRLLATSRSVGAFSLGWYVSTTNLGTSTHTYLLPPMYVTSK